MSPSPLLDAAHLPPDAVPFVRELVLEMVRRAPPWLGTPPRFEVADLEDPGRCANSARSLVQWFDTAPEALDQRMESLEARFGSLLELARSLDGGLRRAVRQARTRAEEESTFAATLREVLQELRGALGPDGATGHAARLLDEVLRRIGARTRGRGENLGVSELFDRIQTDLDRLQEDVAAVEAQTRRLRAQSLRDPLTGLWNRRAYEARLAEEVARADRYRFPLAVARWDVDCFAAINQRHGHPVGDLVLQALAGRVLSMLRRSDVLARIDGEEFAIIFTSTPGTQAQVAAEKVRRLVSETPVQCPCGAIPVSASAGVAELRPGDSPEAIHTRAGEALSAAQQDSLAAAG